MARDTAVAVRSDALASTMTPTYQWGSPCRFDDDMSRPLQRSSMAEASDD